MTVRFSSGFHFAFPLALVLLTSCNSKSDQKTTATSTATSKLPDPCSLLTQEEAEGVLGEPVNAPNPSSLGGNQMCDYKTAKLHGGIAPYSIHIVLTPEKVEAWNLGKKMHTDSKEAQPASGIGEDAYFLLDDLEIRQKDLSLTVNVLKAIDRPDHKKQVQEAEKAVAQKIVARL
jgi:hypothetical protein